MSRYIELDKAIGAVNGAFEFKDMESLLVYRDIAVETLKLLPSVEERHGRWLYDDGAMHKCSVCGELSCCTSHYCGECGAKMDEEEDNG